MKTCVANNTIALQLSIGKGWRAIHSNAQRYWIVSFCLHSDVETWHKRRLHYLEFRLLVRQNTRVRNSAVPPFFSNRTIGACRLTP